MKHVKSLWVHLIQVLRRLSFLEVHPQPSEIHTRFSTDLSDFEISKGVTLENVLTKAKLQPYVLIPASLTP